MSGMRAIKRAKQREEFRKVIPGQSFEMSDRKLSLGAPQSVRVRDLGKVMGINREERRNVANGLMRKMLAGERPS